MMNDKKENVAALLKKGILVSPDFVDEANSSIQSSEDLLVLSRESRQLLSRPGSVNWMEIEKVRAMHERGMADLPSLDDIAPAPAKLAGVEIINSYEITNQKTNVSHFTAYFSRRFHLLESLLRGRPELKNLTSVMRIGSSPSNVSIIGLVQDKIETKNKNIMLTVEDPTGQQRVILSRNRADLYREARDIVTDEVIGISGSCRDGVMFANAVVFPDIPSVDLKKSPEEEYLACMSDLHFGSKKFMADEFNRFISWTNMESGNAKQKRMAEKLKYILIAGDVVDGIGVYADQFSELSITDLKKQYDACARALSEIPERITIIISPGNHDAVRMAEPQPPLRNAFTESLAKLKNVLLVSNPAAVRIGAKENFPGFNCLLYHGYSFDHYVANVDSIRLNGGYDRADLIMNFLLKRRHLAPAHTSTLISPTPENDALFIDPVPDFFVAGHIHRTSISNYKATTLVNSSCWQSMTSFQERLGHNPQPARLPVINLKTRDASIINFNK
ncbi:metallophosphoesterase [Candidatus Woesearchaeota archaeon]|nr:metallophosphoesterase [Candidatus Woesearchaeota archaeon]